MAATKAIAESGLTPLDWMLSVLRDPAVDFARRDWAAKAAAPYVHPTYAAIQHSGPDGGPFVVHMDATDAAT